MRFSGLPAGGADVLFPLPSLCVVPVTLTLSNCAAARMDVILDLRRASRSVSSGEQASTS